MHREVWERAVTEQLDWVAGYGRSAISGRATECRGAVGARCRRLPDFDRPIGLPTVNVIHFVFPDRDAAGMR